MRTNQKNMEIIAFDLRSILKSHPGHAAIIKWMTEGANPRYLWGLTSTACFLRHHDEEMSGLWAFEGETAEQRDSRVIADMKEDMLEHPYFYPGGCSDELLRLLFALKPAYYYEYPRKGKAAKKILKPNKAVYQSGATTLDFDKLVLARTRLEQFLLDTYGQSASFTPLKSEPPKPRFAVFVQETGLSVKLTLTDKESRTEKQEVNGVPFTEFAALVPKSFDSFIVKTSYWSLDKSLCDPEETM